MFKCTVGILDVTKGRKTLLERLKKGPVEITIKGKIIGPWSRDDGESMEFELFVEKINELSSLR